MKNELKSVILSANKLADCRPTVGEVNVISFLRTHLQLNDFTFNNVYLSIKIYSSIHLVIFAAPIFKALKNYFLWFFMITLQLTGPNNGNRTLAPNTSKIVNKNTILDFYTFLSNLKVLKCNMHFNLEQIVEKYTCLLSREIGFLAWQIGRGRRGAFMAFILDLCNIFLRFSGCGHRICFVGMAIFHIFLILEEQISVELLVENQKSCLFSSNFSKI